MNDEAITNQWVLKRVYFDKDGYPSSYTAPVFIPEEMMHNIIDEAYSDFRRYRGSVRGQMIMPQDGIEYWLIRSAEKAIHSLNTNRDN